jgi:regulator of nucleoside diphosphate kinase
MERIAMRRHRMMLLESDAARLRAVLDDAKTAARRDCVETLEETIEAAEIVQSSVLPPNVVRMNSEVYVTDLESGEDSVYTLVFPQHADMERHYVSVLAPIGAALLGSRVGQVITPITPAGRRRLRVGAIVREHDAVPAAY